MCPNYIITRMYAGLQKCKIWDCFWGSSSQRSELKNEEEGGEDDHEILKFWVPQRSFSTQSVQSFSPSLKNLKRDSVTSASTIAEDDGPVGYFSQRRHSDISRAAIGRSHEWPQRVIRFSSTDYFLERTNSASSIKLSLYKNVIENIKSERNSITEEGEVNCQPKCQQNSSSSTTSDNSSTDETLTYGMLTFSANYDPLKKRLNIHLDKGCDLPHKGRKKTYDTILKINLMPKQHEANLRNSFTSKDSIISMQSSRKVKNTLNPHFHEDFIFEVEKQESLKNLVLRLSLYDYERQGRFDAIGHIVLPLNCLNQLGESHKHNLPFKSQTSLEFNDNGPQLLVSLAYTSSTDRLTVGILRSKRLLTKKYSLFESLLKGANNSKVETYVKVTLMCASNKIKSMKTNLVMAESDTDPVYNQTFNFVAPHGFIDEISVVITVCLKGKLKFDSVIGRVISGPIAFASNDKLTHWGKMMFGSEQVITEWRNLYL